MQKEMKQVAADTASTVIKLSCTAALIQLELKIAIRLMDFHLQGRLFLAAVLFENRLRVGGAFGPRLTHHGGRIAQGRIFENPYCVAADNGAFVLGVVTQDEMSCLVGNAPA